MWFADSSGAIGQVSPAGAIIERTRGLHTGSSPVAVAPGADGDMWFTDEGETAAVGRVTGAGVIREFSDGVTGGSEPAAIAPAADGDMWFTDEGSAAGFGVITSGAPGALRSAPRLTATPRPGLPVACSPARFAIWAGLAPTASAARFDGYRWLRNGTVLGGHHSSVFTPSRHDAGARVSCREVVTYPPPLGVTAVATSPPRRVAGRPASATRAVLRLIA
jgi:hypothetical protein